MLDLYARFIAMPADDINAGIEAALHKITPAISADHCSIYRISTELGELRIAPAWTSRKRADGLAALLAPLTGALNRLRTGEQVIFASSSNLPVAPARERRVVPQLGGGSQVATPIMVAGNLVAILVADCTVAEGRWTEPTLCRLRQLAELFASVLERKSAHEELDRVVGFEALATGILASLLLAGPENQDSAILSGLTALARFLGADIAALWDWDATRREFSIVQRWVDPAVSVPAALLPADAVPWLAKKMLAGERVFYAHRGELPAEAAVEAQMYDKSMLVLPLERGGALAGGLVLGCNQQPRDWPARVIGGVELLARVFGTIRARQLAERRADSDRAALQHITRVDILGQLSASIAHQLNQPLAAILANAEAAQTMLERGACAGSAPVDMAELRAICDDIVSEDVRAAEVIRRLGALYKRGEMVRVPIDANDLVRETLDLLRTELISREVVVLLDLGQDLPACDGGRVQLQQVLLNLVINAADAMAAMPAETRRLTITTRAAGDTLRICVTDAGPGITADKLATIFEAFWTSKPGGMGIGLAVCRSIVEAHHGQLTVDSPSNTGATFCVSLPLRHIA